MFNRDSTRKIVTALEMVMVLVSSLVFNGALQQQKNLVRSLTPILHLTRERELGEGGERGGWGEREEDGNRPFIFYEWFVSIDGKEGQHQSETGDWNRGGSPYWN
jgi:hypothetical protein